MVPTWYSTLGKNDYFVNLKLYVTRYSDKLGAFPPGFWIFYFKILYSQYYNNKNMEYFSELYLFNLSEFFSDRLKIQCIIWQYH
jgi:hypothetical protein